MVNHVNAGIVLYSDEFFNEFIDVIDKVLEFTNGNSIAYSIEDKFFGDVISFSCNILVLNRPFDLRELNVFPKMVIIFKGLKETIKEIEDAFKEMHG